MTRPDAVQPQGPTDLLCPRCRAALFEGKAGPVTVLGCAACGGVWLSNELSQRVVERMDAALLTLADRAAAAGRGEVDASGTAYCPHDGLPLSRVTAKGVSLDVCASHGTWFDAGELRRVAEAFDGPRRAAAASFTPMFVPPAASSWSSSSSSSSADGSAGTDALVGLFALAVMVVIDSTSSSDD